MVIIVVCNQYTPVILTTFIVLSLEQFNFVGICVPEHHIAGLVFVFVPYVVILYDAVKYHKAQPF